MNDDKINQSGIEWLLMVHWAHVQEKDTGEKPRHLCVVLES